MCPCVVWHVHSGSIAFDTNVCEYYYMNTQHIVHPRTTVAYRNFLGNYQHIHNRRNHHIFWLLLFVSLHVSRVLFTAFLRPMVLSRLAMGSVAEQTFLICDLSLHTFLYLLCVFFFLRNRHRPNVFIVLANASARVTSQHIVRWISHRADRWCVPFTLRAIGPVRKTTNYAGQQRSVWLWHDSSRHRDRQKTYVRCNRLIVRRACPCESTG